MNFVKIYYEPQETGPAEVLYGRVARICKTPVLNMDLCRDAIVLLDRDPSNDDPIAEIEEVLHNPYGYRSTVRFLEEADGWELLHVFTLLGADAELAWLPKDGKPGLLLVSHEHHLDPAALAEAAGVEQSDDDDE